MAKQSLIIIDGAQVTQSLEVDSGSFGYIPYHAISSSADEPVHVTASFSNPLAVTGSFSAVFPATQAVTASFGNPVAVTGGVSVSNFPATQAVTASFGNPVAVTGTVNTNIDNGLKVELSGSNVKLLSGSTTNTYLQVHLAPTATGSVKSRVLWSDPSPGAGSYFDWGSPQSGTVLVASSSVSRKSLVVFNPSPADLYISLGLEGYPDTNGFSLFSTASAPNFYTFILYASGTYFADPQNVGVTHALYAISSSGVETYPGIMITETY